MTIKQSPIIEAHSTEIYAAYRGKYIGIAGEELFAADTPEEALAMAIAAHPDDNGRFTRLIPQEKMARVCVDQWHVACVRGWLHTPRDTCRDSGG